MNIFFLSIDAKKCAKYHFDSHIVKMPTECAQILSFAFHVLHPELGKELYQKGLIYATSRGHANHPCSIWARAHINNFRYIINLGLELCNEWRYRYNHPKDKLHGAEYKLLYFKNNLPSAIPKFKIKPTEFNPLRFTLPMPQAMFNDCRHNFEVSDPPSCQKAYRNFYMSKYKYKLRKWTKKSDKCKCTRTCRINIDKPNWFKPTLL